MLHISYVIFLICFCFQFHFANKNYSNFFIYVVNRQSLINVDETVLSESTCRSVLFGICFFKALQLLAIAIFLFPLSLLPSFSLFYFAFKWDLFILISQINFNDPWLVFSFLYSLWSVSAENRQ